jgi:hypothetical protein
MIPWCFSKGFIVLLGRLVVTPSVSIKGNSLLKEWKGKFHIR